MIVPKHILLVIALVLIGKSAAQELPPIQNFSPADYQAESQNWDFAQGGDKAIYMANNRGLLTYNGARWDLYPTPNESIVRSVHVVGNRIYTGCYMEFGFWEKDQFGQLTYTSLSTNLDTPVLEDEEFWGILDFGERMVFQSHYRIYTYNLGNNTATVIESEAFIPKAFQVKGTVYFQKMNEGIFKIENGQEVLVSADESLKSDEIINIFELGPDLMFLTRYKGFYRLTNNVLEKWTTEADGILEEISLYSGIQLKNGDYALGTISHGLIFMDSQGKMQHHINQAMGLQNNTVLAVMEDLDNNIWLGLDVGISNINIASPFHVYPDSGGSVGSVYAAAKVDDKLYLGTNQGLFYKTLDTNSDFVFVEGTHGQVWFLDVIQDTLFCGHHTGTFIVEGTIVQKIANIQGTWKIGELSAHPNLLLQGNYDGLYILEKEGATWKLRNKISGFDNSARHFEAFGETLFVNHEYKGLFKLQLDEGFKEVRQTAIDSLIRGSNSGIANYQGDLLYAHKNGILRYNWETETFSKDSILSSIYNPDEYVSGKMVLDQQNGYLWTFSNSNISYISRDGLAGTPRVTQIPLSEDMRNGIIGYESVVPLEREKYLVGARSGYFTINMNAHKDHDFTIRINRVQKAGKNRVSIDESLTNPLEPGDFDSDENSLVISYNVPSYKKYQRPYYRFRLQEIYPNWSDWSIESEVSFENLPPGSYSFQVQAKIGDQTSENPATYTFIIARPWYKSNLFILFYVIGGVLLSIVIHGSYRRYYHTKQQKIIQENKREMELAKAQNEKEIVKLKNQQLKEEFRSKSNELAASTMSIIKKNELLSKIKDQLASNVEDKNSVKPIIHIIDKNINQNDDWEMFKEAFNNADRKFLKKLKKAHPNLSPNDIRLCAYLRLNLSSKEIAPMFNISPRSVEIKRYRLRKKMNLDHDDNLVDYILKL